MGQYVGSTVEKTSTKIKEANPGLNSRIKYEFAFPNYSVQEMATILENGNRESGYRYEGKLALLTFSKKKQQRRSGISRIEGLIKIF